MKGCPQTQEDSQQSLKKAEQDKRTEKSVLRIVVFNPNLSQNV